MGDTTNALSKDQLSKTCFVVSPIGEEGSSTRAIADKVFKHLIQKSLPVEEFELIRADKISDPGIITNQIMSYIEKSDLVISDLSGQNPNVFYETAIRHALRKPIIQIVQAGDKIPFDISAVRTIFYDLTDPDALERAQEQLSTAASKIFEPGYKVESPFSVSIPLNAIDAPKKGALDTTDVILNEIQKISVRIQNIESNIDAQNRNLAFPHAEPVRYVFDQNAYAAVNKFRAAPPPLTEEEAAELSKLLDSRAKIRRLQERTQKAP